MVIHLSDVRVRRADRDILGPIDWRVGEGERWVVLGANGSGKSTLLAVCSMSLWPSSGSVDVLGQHFGAVDARELRRRIGSAGSAIEASLRDDLPARTLIMTARHAALEPWWHVYTAADAARAGELGAHLGLDGRLDQAFGSLSAGERRRVTIARALMPDPELLLLDEPTANLDLAARELLLRDLHRLAGRSRPRAIVLVTHHLEDIPPGFGHALLLVAGRAVAAGPIDQVLRADTLSGAFGVPLDVHSADGRWSARLAGA